MTTERTHQLGDAVRGLLRRRAGSQPDAHEVAVAAMECWEEVSARLSPSLGQRGVEFLFRRALSVTTQHYPWLAEPGELEGIEVVVPSLKIRLAERGSQQALEASQFLLSTFVDVLCSLLGPALAGRLLRPVELEPGSDPGGLRLDE